MKTINVDVNAYLRNCTVSIEDEYWNNKTKEERERIVRQKVYMDDFSFELDVQGVDIYEE